METGARFSFLRLGAVLGVGFALAAVAFVVSVVFGEQRLSWEGVRSPGSAQQTILLALRLPRVLLAAVVGAALAASGTVLQSLLRNSLADPFALGVSGGAALGATVALAFGFSVAWLPGFSAVSGLALVGAVAATLLVLAIGRLAGGDPSHTTLLAGVILNAVALAAILLLKALAAPDRLGAVLFWLAGALGPEAPTTVAATGAIVLFALLVMMAKSPALNVLTLGDEDAQSLGVDVPATRLVLLLVASLAVAAAVALSGLVGFVGLLVPHGVRLVVGVDQRLAVPASALGGAAFLMLADLVARLSFLAFGTELPVGVVTALLGGPLFLALLARRGATRGPGQPATRG